MTLAPVRVDRSGLEACCAEVFMACGVPADPAACQAKVLVAADARGIPSHGIARLRRYVDGIATGQVIGKAKPSTLRESPVSILLDGCGGLGAPAGEFAMESVILKAKSSGMAFAAIRNSNHFGIAGYYAMMALGEDMIGLAMTNTAALGVPTFAREVMFGTNPIALAAPAGSERPFVLDMATTVVTRGKIETCARQGRSLPPGWAVDGRGMTALEPETLLESLLRRTGGGIVPLGGESETHGGHKGYGLAVMVDILTGLLSGGGFGPEVYDTDLSSARVSHCFAAIRIDLFQEPGVFKSDMDRYLSALRNCRPAEGAERVYYAGLKEAEAEDEAAIRGVPLEPAVFRALAEIARSSKVAVPHPA